MLWTDSHDPDEHPFTYTVEIAYDAEFNTIVHKAERITDNYYIIDDNVGLPDLKKFYWRVKTIDFYGGLSLSPDVFSFTTNNTNAGIGRIIGHVYDAGTNEVIYNALIKVGILTVAPKSSGNYVCSIDAGIYTVTVSADGYETKVYSGMEVRQFSSIDDIRVRDFYLNSTAENRPPELNFIESQLADEGKIFEFNVTAADPDGDPITFSAENLPVGSVFNTNGKFTWLPEYGQEGNYNITFFASDDEGLQVSSICSITVNKAFSLNIDGNINNEGVEEADALTDGILIIRYLFGLTEGESLIANAVDEDSERNSAEQIGQYIEGCKSMLDIDGNGKTDALTDGLLIIRYLFGYRGDSLINNAVDTQNGTRIIASDIESYIEIIIP